MEPILYDNYHNYQENLNLDEKELSKSLRIIIEEIVESSNSYDSSIKEDSIKIDIQK